MNETISTRLLLSLISLGLISFFSVLIETSLNVTFPYLCNLYDIDIKTASLLTSMFLLGITLIMPLSGYLLNTFNTLKLFIFTNVVFLISLLICVYFNYFALLVFARFIQGISAGIALPLMFNMVILQAPKKYFGFLMGFCVFLVACAPGLGPIWGGYIMQFYGFKNIFIFTIPFIFLAFLLGLFSIKNIQTKYDIKFKLFEYVLLIFCLLTFIAVFKNPLFIFAFFVFLYLLIKQNNSNSLINFEVFKSVVFRYGIFIIFFTQFMALTFSLILTNYLIKEYDLDSFSAGSVMLCGCICAAILAPISGYLSDKINNLLIISFGAFIICLANCLFLILEKNLLNFSLLYLLFAVGQGISMSVTMAYIIKNSILKTDANTFINTFQQFFGVLGVVISSLIFENYGFDYCVFLILILSILSLIFIFIIVNKL